jgi:hypothetical protein
MSEAQAPKPPENPRHPLAGKTSRTIGVFLLLAMLPYAVPGLARLQGLLPPSMAGLLRIPIGQVAAASAAEAPGPAGEESAPSSGSADAEFAVVVGPAVPGTVEDPSGRAR